MTADIGSFLNGMRRRIDSATPSLGEYDRLKSRRGKRVSQEEVAEAVGVSRGWYQRLESGAIRPSISLLNRLVGALNASPEERTRLFRLAIPALHSSPEAFENLSFVRSVSSRLLAASSECEALTIAAEHLASWFADAMLIVPVKRIDAGRWSWWFAADGDRQTEWSRCIEEISTKTTRQQFDEFWSYPRLQSSGETADDADHELVPELRQLTVESYNKHGLAMPSFLRSRISTRRGLIAGIQVNHRLGRTYSNLDRAALAAVAELTSLALS